MKKSEKIINSLVLYSNLKENTLIKLIIKAENGEKGAFSKIISFLFEKAEENALRGNILKNYIIHIMLRDRNMFTLLCENNEDVKNTSVYKAAVNDIEKIKEIANMDISELSEGEKRTAELVKDYIPVKNKKNITHKQYDHWKEIYLMGDKIFDIENIISFHNKNGCGDVSVFGFFRYDSENKKLIGVTNPDNIKFSDLIGYKNQIDTLKDNTLSFIKGYASNNVLLVGARGTGKSSSVKALVNEYFDIGLRILEITKEQIVNLPDILNILRQRGRKFIIFIDDLSFDENEIGYKYMKSLIEGGTEGKPENVLFYATSNRRHIIQEKWKDRGETITESRDVHTMDNMNEKLSLSDRFGITITYQKPTPDEYINIVKGILKNMNFEMDEENIKKEAMKWELRQKGMSGRTAKQFVNNIIWKIKKEKEYEQ